jgi:hypothetical protein
MVKITEKWSKSLKNGQNHWKSVQIIKNGLHMCISKNGQNLNERSPSVIPFGPGLKQTLLCLLKKCFFITLSFFSYGLECQVTTMCTSPFWFDIRTKKIGTKISWAVALKAWRSISPQAFNLANNYPHGRRWQGNVNFN